MTTKSIVVWLYVFKFIFVPRTYLKNRFHLKFSGDTGDVEAETRFSDRFHWHLFGTLCLVWLFTHLAFLAFRHCPVPGCLDASMPQCLDVWVPDAWQNWSGNPLLNAIFAFEILFCLLHLACKICFQFLAIVPCCPLSVFVLKFWKMPREGDGMLSNGKGEDDPVQFLFLVVFSAFVSSSVLSIAFCRNNLHAPRPCPPPHLLLYPQIPVQESISSIYTSNPHCPILCVLAAYVAVPILAIVPPVVGQLSPENGKCFATELIISPPQVGYLSKRLFSESCHSSLLAINILTKIGQILKDSEYQFFGIFLF